MNCKVQTIHQPCRLFNLIFESFMSGYAFGSLLGPIVAGILSDYFGYQRAFSILGFMLLTAAFFYLPVIFKNIESV
jgi:MFS family permease